VEEYFATCPWMNDIYGLKYGLKKDELYYECCQQMLFLQKIEQKKQGQNHLCWFLSKQFDK
jgi:hypothetical protein